MKKERPEDFQRQNDDAALVISYRAPYMDPAPVQSGIERDDNQVASVYPASVNGAL